MAAYSLKMLPSKNRLNKKKDFENIFRKGKNFKEGFLLLKIAKGESGQSRYGFIVSQKISKKAVIRNKVRRRLSEITGKEMKNLKVGMDVVIIALPGAERSSFLETEKVIKKLFKKAVIS